MSNPLSQGCPGGCQAGHQHQGAGGGGGLEGRTLARPNLPPGQSQPGAGSPSPLPARLPASGPGPSPEGAPSVAVSSPSPEECKHQRLLMLVGDMGSWASIRAGRLTCLANVFPTNTPASRPRARLPGLSRPGPGQPRPLSHPGPARPTYIPFWSPALGNPEGGGRGTPGSPDIPRARRPASRQPRTRDRPAPGLQGGVVLEAAAGTGAEPGGRGCGAPSGVMDGGHIPGPWCWGAEAWGSASRR